MPRDETACFLWLQRIMNRLERGHIVVAAKTQIVGGDDQGEAGRRAAAPGRGDYARPRRAVAAARASRCARAGLGKDRGASGARPAATWPAWSNPHLPQGAREAA